MDVFRQRYLLREWVSIQLQMHGHWETKPGHVLRRAGPLGALGVFMGAKKGGWEGDGEEI